MRRVGCSWLSLHGTTWACSSGSGLQQTAQWCRASKRTSRRISIGITGRSLLIVAGSFSIQWLRAFVENLETFVVGNADVIAPGGFAGNAEFGLGVSSPSL